MIVVIGAGPAGLAAAYRLRSAGHEVRVLEASGAVGGKMLSSERDGFLLDRGAFFLPTTHRPLLAIAEDAGCADRIVPGGFRFGLARDGRVHHLDGDHLLRDLVRTRALSVRSKLLATRLGPEVLRARRATIERIHDAGRYDTETVEAWARRTLNHELAEYVARPVMRSIFAVDPDEISRADFLGVIALFKGARLVAFDRGMGVYAETLARGLDIALHARVRSVEEGDGEVRVSWTDGDGTEHAETAAGCVVAVSARTAAAIVGGLDPWRAGYLSRVRDGRLACLNVALSRAPSDLTATYTMVPRSVHPFLGGIGCDHHKAPGRAPRGKGLLTLAPLTGWSERHWDETDAQISDALLEALDTVLPGVADHVEFTVVNRWTQAYNPVGHYRELARFRRACEGDRLVHLAGEYDGSPQLATATASGERAARRLTQVVQTIVH